MHTMFKNILTSSLLFLVAIGGFFVSVESNNSSNKSIHLTIVSSSYAADCKPGELCTPSSSTTPATT